MRTLPKISVSPVQMGGGMPSLAALATNGGVETILKSFAPKSPKGDLSSPPFGGRGARAKTAVALLFILFNGSFFMKTYAQGLVQANGNDIAYTMRNFGVKMNNPVLPFEVNGSGKFYKNLFVDSLITSWHIQTQQIEAGTATITGDLTAQKLTVTSTVLFNSLSGSGNGLVGIDSYGELKRYNLTGNATDYFRGDGTFGNLSSATGWQLVGGTLVSTVNDVAVPGTLSVGHSINIGSFRFKNSALINEEDTVITDRNIKIMTLADKIALEADTVTMREYTRVGSDTSKFAPPVTGKLALEVAGSATVIGDLAVKGAVNSNEVKTNTITTNNLTTNIAISSPKVITSHITSPDSVLILGDSTIYINQTNNRIYTLNQPLHIYSINETMRISAFGTNGELRLQTAAGSGNTIIGNAVGIGTYSITSGTMLDVVNKFQVNTNGDLVKINNISYAWPSIQGAAGSLLKNDGSGGLSWVNSGNASSPIWSVTGNIGTTAGTNFIGTTDAVDFVIKTNSSEKMRIMGTGTHPGNMGLGTSNPQKKLHIRTTHDITGIGTDESDANDAVGTHQGIRLENWVATNSSIWDIEPIVDNGESKFTIGQPTTPRLTINSSGNVGIGTTSPGGRLQVGSDTKGLRFRDDGSAVDIQSVGVPLYINSTGNNIYLAPNGGNVGIGTTSPDGKLHTQGGIAIAHPTIAYDPSGNAGSRSGIIFGANHATNNAMFWMAPDATDGNSFHIGTGGDYNDAGALMTIQANGKVGIGTDDIPSGYLMAVNGNLIATDINIALQSDWPPPDYVFEFNYERPTWLDKKQYYRKYKRLMYMDNAKEIKKNGFSMTKNIFGIMQNVEEISLDIIDLYEIMLEQREQIKKLEKEIRELKNKK